MASETIVIPLTQGFRTKVDADLPDHLHWIFEVKWHAHFSRCGVYARTSARGKKFLHRVIANTPRHLQTDHINRDTLDNRRNNLRNCKASTNMRNRANWTRSNEVFEG